MVAAAVVGAGALTAGASVIGANKAAKAQGKAAAQASQIEQSQLDEQTREYNQNRTDLAPWRDAGTYALGQLKDMTSGDPSTVSMQLKSDPGYQFRMDQGTKAINTNAAAHGSVLSGGTLKALARYGSDYSSSEFDKRFNRLSSIAGLGQTANGQALGASANYMQLQQQGANDIAGNTLAAGNARASQYAGTANAIGGFGNSVGGYFALRDLTGGAKVPAASYGGYTGTGDYGYGDAGAYGISGSDGIY